MRIKTLPILLAVTLMTASCGKAPEVRKKVTDSQMSGDLSVSAEEDAAAEDAMAVMDENTAPEEQTTGKAVVRLGCAGDNIIHDNIYVEAMQEDGSYDFTECYAPCKKLLEDTDIAVLNQETVVNDAFAPSTFPRFSTPTELGDAVVDLGFNVISMANNHVLDQGVEGLISSLDYWDSKEVVHYGAYRDEEDSEQIRTMEVNGITFAFLGYTEHTNGISMPYGGDGKVVYIEERDTLERQIRAADEIADVVVVSCHYGTEVLNDLNNMQIELTPKLVEWGADLIIGTQSHALSTCEYLDKPDGGQAFVYYGLGNFLSTMYDADNPDGRYGRALIGIFGKLDVVKDYDNGGAISFENVKAIPVVSHYEGESWTSMWYNCRIYPYGDYTDELLLRHMMYLRAGVGRKTLESYIAYIPEEFLAYE